MARGDFVDREKARAAGRKGGKIGGANKKGYRKPEKRTWEDLEAYILGDGADKVVRLMEEQNDPKAFGYLYNKLVDFVKPRKREMSGEINIPISVTFKNIKGDDGRDR